MQHDQLRDGLLAVLGGRLGLREWAAIAAMTAGVIGFLACLGPRPGHPRPVSPAGWIIGSAVSAAVLAALFFAARAARSPARRAALLGAACGLGYGLAAAYMKGMTDQFAAGGVTGALASWQLYAAAVAGLLATWLLQNAYHAGRLTAAQPGITLADPLVATVWGVAILGERVNGGLLLGLSVLPVLVLAAGAVLLSRSPVLHAAAGADERSGPPDEPRDPARAGQPGEAADS